MSDKSDIQELLNTYTIHGSRGDWETALSTFTPDGVWAIPAFDVSASGVETIASVIGNFVSAMDFIAQLNSPALIQIDGDKATAKSVIRECGKHKGRNEAMEIVGIYHDDLVRTADGWRFTLRSFEVISMHD